MKRPLLELRNATLKYESRTGVALDDVSIAIDRGEFLAIVGPSGAGKSSLLNVLGLLDFTQSDSYLVDGAPVNGMRERAKNRMRMHDFGFVFQAAHMLLDRTVEDNVALPLAVQGLSPELVRERTAKALAAVGLTFLAGSKASTLSGGELQRVAIARAVVNSPRVILADEPTGSLDEANSAAVMDALQTLSAKGVTVVVVTHSSHVAARAGRLIKLAGGRVVYDSHAGNSSAGLSMTGGGQTNGSARRWRRALFYVSDALQSLYSRKVRSALILLSFVWGAGGLGAAAGVSEAASRQIQQDITKAALDTLYVALPSGGDSGSVAALVDEIEQISHVNSVGVRVDIASADAKFSLLGPVDPSVAPSRGVNVIAADEQYLHQVLDELPYQTWWLDEDKKYVLVGEGLAERLGIGVALEGRQIWVLGAPYQVTGVIRDHPELSTTAVINGAHELAGTAIAVNSVAVVQTRVGYPAKVADLIPRITNQATDVTTAADLESLRLGVAQNLSSLIFMVSSVLLVLAVLSATGMLTLSVNSRIGEIALRRAIGVPRSVVALTFVLEGMLLGLAGGIAGATAGILGVLALCLLQGWSPHMSPTIIVVGLVSGICTGVAASAIPALRASLIHPAQGLRR